MDIAQFPDLKTLRTPDEQSLEFNSKSGVKQMSTTTRKPTSWLKFGENVSEQRRSKAELRQLGESMRKEQIHPIVTFPDGTILTGYERALAALLVGLEEVEVKIIEGPLTKIQVKLFQLVENLERKDLSAWTIYERVNEILEENPEWTIKDIAEQMDRDASTLTRHLSANRCITVVREALKAGKIGSSDTYAIAKYPQEEQEHALAMRLNGASRDELEQHRRKPRRANGSGRKLQIVTLPFPSGMTVTVRGPKVGMEELNQIMVDIQRELRHARDKLHVDDAKDFERVLRRRLKRGTVTEVAHA